MSKATTGMSLLDWATAHRRPTGMHCSICERPERAEIDAAIAKGIGPTLIARWLQEVCGIPTGKEHAIRRHRRICLVPKP